MIKNVEITRKPQTFQGVLIEEENLSLICSLYDFIGVSVTYDAGGKAESVTFKTGRGGHRGDIEATFGQVLVRVEGTPFREYRTLDIVGDSETFKFEVLNPNG